MKTFLMNTPESQGFTDSVFYVYQLRVEGESLPFYIGKGKGDRAWVHLKPCDLASEGSRHKKNTILKAQREGKQVLVEVIRSGIADNQSKRLEKFWIAKFGRADQGKGPLTNGTDGGDGLANPSKETRAKIAEAKLGENNPMFGKSHSDERKNRVSELLKENAPWIGKYGADHPKSGKLNSEETKKMMSDSHSHSWLITHPTGETETVTNLVKFCAEKGLQAANMRGVAYGKCTHHKGYRCSKI